MAQWLALAETDNIAQVIRDYGEERFAGPIARRIVRERQIAPITTSSQLNKIVIDVVPVAPGKTNGHPAKRIYQALRIAVNDELGVLEDAMPQAIDALAVGGRQRLDLLRREQSRGNSARATRLTRHQAQANLSLRAGG